MSSLHLNPFEAGSRRIIPAVLIYVIHEGRVLMMNRVTRGAGADYHHGKWNGLGGKLELNESPIQGAMRELKEEANLSLPQTAFRCLGTVQFPNFKAARDEDWMVFVFRAELGSDLPPEALLDLISQIPDSPRAGDEGELHWIEAADVLGLNLWAGDILFMPLVLKGRPFHGTIWYEGEAVRDYWIQPL